MYTVIGTSKSRALRVVWMLEELGLPYDHIPAHPHSPEIMAANPSGKVPALILDTGEAITDSTAILQFLADRHGAMTHPAGTIDRARQDSLTQMILDEIDAVIWTAARHSFILPPDQRVPAVKDPLKWEFSRNQARLADHLGDKPFLMGETMTVPDVILGQCLTWAKIAKFPETDPRLADYGERLLQRPACQRALSR